MYQHFLIKVKCFICNRPARTFVKGIKRHTGYFQCERCTINGSYYKKQVIFDSCDNLLRSDATFRNQEQKEHHLQESPLTQIKKIDMVYDFVLDYMHLGCLRVQKKITCRRMDSSNKQNGFITDFSKVS